MCFQKLYNFDLPLCSITTNGLLWESLVECLYLWHGRFFKLLLIAFPQLFMPMFLISHMDIGFLMMIYTLPFPWVRNLGKKFKFYLHLKAWWMMIQLLMMNYLYWFITLKGRWSICWIFSFFLKRFMIKGKPII